MLPEVELGVVPLPVVVTVASVVVGPADPCWHCVKMSAYPKPDMIVHVTYLGVPLVYSHAGITRYTSGFATIARTAALTPGRDGGICRWDGCQQQQGGILMHGEMFGISKKVDPAAVRKGKGCAEMSIIWSAGGCSL